jgi:hypothetical protein
MEEKTNVMRLIEQILDNEMAGQRSRLIPNGLK